MLTAVVHVGEPASPSEGFEPSVVVHLHEDSLPRFIASELRSDGELERVPGTYPPDPHEEPPSPVTDRLLALYRKDSTVGHRLDILSTKGEANYGVGFRRTVFDSDVGPGSDGYGRHFEARSRPEARRYEAVVAVGLLAGIDADMQAALETNLDRLDAPARRFVTPKAGE